MSKVDELRLKYINVPSRTFNKFAEADKTPTKKYLDYLLKCWVNRGYNDCPQTTDALINLVHLFDELLPYITEKDIYAKEFNSVSYLRLVIARAEEVREEKTFNKEEHILVLHETNDYLLISPLTHRGSVKYGRGTKWCTAAINETSTFQRYSRNGLLGYVVDKTGKRSTNYHKFALYFEYTSSAFSGEVDVFNAYDTDVADTSLLNNGWSEEEVHTILWYFRSYFVHMKKTRKSKEYIDKFTTTLGSLDFKTLSEHIQILEQTRNSSYISSLEQTITNLYNNLNNQEYARFTTKS